MLPSDGATPEGRYRALIVEDDAAIRRLIEKLLSRKGIDVDIAIDGRVAVEKLGAGKYSVIVLDLMVPEITGFDVIEYVKANGITAPVAVVSAVSQQSLTRLDLDVVKLVMMKPFDVDEFTKAIVELCADADSASN
ncbi:MAG TPA: response regulator [Thermoanaerobaculia bacterium]|nr:response regulator [Thermoanaerobaculia bacterium]